MSASIHVSARHTRLDGLLDPQRALYIVRLALRFALIVASLLGTLVIGLYSQIYEGPHASWVARELSGALYALAWCLGLATLRPNARPFVAGLSAAAICFVVEASQLWHPHALEVARATLPGRLVLGSAFMWTDLPYYGVGALVGAAWLRLLPFRRRRSEGEAAEFVRPMGVQP